MIVVADERGHLERRHIVDDGVLGATVAGKTEVDIIDVGSAADHVLIYVARARSASALSYRASVINEGRERAIEKSLAKRRSLGYADQKLVNAAVGGEVYGEIAKLL